MTDPDNPGVTIEVTIAAPVKAVWQSLRGPAWIRRWHGWHFDGLDQEIDTIYQNNVTGVQTGSCSRSTAVIGSSCPSGGRHAGPDCSGAARQESRVGRLLRRHHRGLDVVSAAAALRAGAAAWSRSTYRLLLRRT
ncbi:MAG: hypothetical protein WKF47_18010 [Geodermatophilaceae bacterium]